MVDFKKLLRSDAAKVADAMVRQEIKDLVKRGNVTPAEWKTLRLNSWERDALIPAMSDELLCAQTEYTIGNCVQFPRPAITYDNALQLYARGVVRRLKLKTGG